MDKRLLQLMVFGACGLGVYGAGAWHYYPQRATLEADGVRRLAWRDRFDVVVVGDSRVQYGVDPSSMETALGNLRVGSFAWSSVGFNRDLLRSAARSLDPKGARVLLLALTPHSLSRRATLDNAFIDTNGSPPLDRLTVANLPIGFEFLSPCGPSHWLRQSNPSTRDIPRVLHEDGWYETSVPQMPAEGVIKLYTERLRASPVDRRILEQLMANVRELTNEGYHVLAFNPPDDPRLAEVEATIGHYDEADIKGRLKAVGGSWLGVPGIYTTFDGSHLGAAEARRFSGELGAQVAGAL